MNKINYHPFNDGEKKANIIFQSEEQMEYIQVIVIQIYFFIATLPEILIVSRIQRFVLAA